MQKFYQNSKRGRNSPKACFFLFLFSIKQKKIEKCTIFSSLSTLNTSLSMGLSPCSPLAGLNKEDTSGQQGHTQARFNKKSVSIKRQPSKPYVILLFPFPTAQRHTIIRVLPGSYQNSPSTAAKRPYTVIFGSLRVLSFYHM